MASVIHADIELFLSHYLRQALAARPEQYCQNVFVDREFPDDDRARAVVVRYDGGPSTSMVTADASVGLTVLADGSQDASALARMVESLVWDCPAVAMGNPVAAVLSTNGPYAVADESSKERRYLTAVLSVAGTVRI